MIAVLYAIASVAVLMAAMGATLIVGWIVTALFRRITNGPRRHAH